MTSPLGTLVTCLHRKDAPPFDWIVEHTEDGMIAPVWGRLNVVDEPLDMFNVLLALDDTYRRPRRAIVAALLEAKRVTPLRGTDEVFRLMKRTEDQRLATIGVFTGAWLANGERRDGRPLIVAVQNFGTWLTSRSHIYARQAFRMINNVHGLGNAIARAVPPPTVDEILAVVVRP